MNFETLLNSPPSPRLSQALRCTGSLPLRPPTVIRDAEAWVAFGADRDHRREQRKSSEAYSVTLAPLREEIVTRTIHTVNRG